MLSPPWTTAELRTLPGFPSDERLAQGPVAVIECPERIPCNPCETVCSRRAIEVGRPITNLPRLDAAQCHGCGRCVVVCPGMAIFIVDLTFEPGRATVTIPYEFLPLPEPGDRVTALNRAGEPLGPAEVVRVQNPPAFDHTALVTIAVPKELALEARHLRAEGSG